MTITRQEAERQFTAIGLVHDVFISNRAFRELCEHLIAALPAEAQEAACNPALTECPRCKNDISKCDSVFATITDARRDAGDDCYRPTEAALRADGKEG
jgi:hypothetical protein